jgi:hypothetical protein
MSANQIREVEVGQLVDLEFVKARGVVGVVETLEHLKTASKAQAVPGYPKGEHIVQPGETWKVQILRVNRHNGCIFVQPIERV